MTKNAEVAKVLKEIGLLLQVEGKDKFKFLAYLRGVRSITALGEDITTVAERGELTKIQGIGKGLAEVITSYLETGEVESLTELRTRVPIKVMELEAIPSVGPKTVKLVYESLGITDLEGLERAALEGKLSDLPGLGTKTEEQIISGIGIVKSGLDRTRLAEALSIAKGIEDELRKIPGIHQLVIAGSARRRRETIGDIDILVDASDSKIVMDTFVGHNDVSSITAHGDTKSSVRLTGGLQIDLRILPAESFGAGLQYFTGSVDHNVRLRSIAKKKNLTLNEYYPQIVLEQDYNISLVVLIITFA